MLRAGVAAILAGGAGWAAVVVTRNAAEASRNKQVQLPKPVTKLPTRHESVKQLREGSFDVLVIGGGASGSGVALEATARGLRVGLVERGDFACGTSSRSTKLLHGGVRYLEAAFFNLDRGQLSLVAEAISDRNRMLQQAPHLASPIAITCPVYSYLQLPYLWAGLKAYDLVSRVHLGFGESPLPSSRMLGVKETLQHFPALRTAGLVGSVQYYDGQMDDARLNLAIALTAAERGATVLNYAEVTELVKEKTLVNGEPKERVVGAMIRDQETGDTFKVSAKVVVNATGPFTDGVLKLDNAAAGDIVQPSQGTHVILPGHFSPPGEGVLIPKTTDGRVLFILNWLGSVLVGTTDTPCKVDAQPAPTDDEIDFILREVSAYLSIPVSRDEVLAAWTGIRPLVINPEDNSASTKSISREHVVLSSASGLVTLSGGKWTSWHSISRHVCDHFLAHNSVGLQAPRSHDPNVLLMGAQHFSALTPLMLSQEYKVDFTIARHLTHAYGDRAWEVLEISDGSSRRRLADGYPWIEAEVRYAARHHFARTAVDVLARRTRLAFLDHSATVSAVPRVLEILAAELGWDKVRIEREETDAKAFLETMKAK